ncbi:MAG: NAD(P)H-dependent oxidoreductase subunit E [Candidatus Omnitrophota bacterium]
MGKFCSMKKIVKKDGKQTVVCDDIRSYLLEALQEIQDGEGFISDENMQKTADKFGIHPVEVYSVVTFYSFLTTEKKGRNIIRVSSCMPCVMKGSDGIVEAFEKKIGVKCGETTGDGKFTLEKTGCIGMCDKAPAVLVNDELIGPVEPGDVDKILDKLK